MVGKEREKEMIKKTEWRERVGYVQRAKGKRREGKCSLSDSLSSASLLLFSAY